MDTRSPGLTHHALDIKLILRQPFDALGFKDDDFPALRLAKIVGQPVHEQMVAGADFHFENIVALMINTIGIQKNTGALLKRLFAKIRRKPDRVFDAANSRRTA